MTIDGWTLTRISVAFTPVFSVHFQAARDVGPAVLTFDIRGRLGDFNSGGTLHVRHGHMAPSRMRATGLNAELTASWSLSAPVSNAVIGFLPSLDLVLPLFRAPLLIGDFPMFLSVEARLHLALVLGQPTQILRGHADISYTGSQGLAFDETQAVGDGRLHEHNRGFPRIAGLPFALPKLDLAVTFPYVDIGDDLNNPLAGALVWTGFTLDTLTGSGANPNLCLRTDVTAHADAGVTFRLFGLTGGLSERLYYHHIGSAAWPPSPPCSQF